MLVSALLVGAAHGARALHYLTCRHGFEGALVAELARGGVAATSPCAALARIDAETDSLPDPAYALQVLPRAVEVRAASIKGLAEGAAAALGAGDASSAEAIHARQLLADAPRGSLETHTLVADTIRGVPREKAKLVRRAESVAEQLQSQLR